MPRSRTVRRRCRSERRSTLHLPPARRQNPRRCRRRSEVRISATREGRQRVEAEVHPDEAAVTSAAESGLPSGTSASHWPSESDDGSLNPSNICPITVIASSSDWGSPGAFATRRQTSFRAPARITARVRSGRRLRMRRCMARRRSASKRITPYSASMRVASFALKSRAGTAWPARPENATPASAGSAR